MLGIRVQPPRILADLLEGHLDQFAVQHELHALTVSPNPIHNGGPPRLQDIVRSKACRGVGQIDKGQHPQSVEDVVSSFKDAMGEVP
ncbi:MAG: hypothetical protein IIC50_00195 [Planctomycetes bacterium]|nr:hypothetical protein [Planctomycetota bacterium]